MVGRGLAWYILSEAYYIVTSSDTCTLKFSKFKIKMMNILFLFTWWLLSWLVFVYHHYNNIFCSCYVEENVRMIATSISWISAVYFLIDAKLINNAVLISAVLQNDSVVHIFILFFVFFYIMGYHRRLGIVPHSIQ